MKGDQMVVPFIKMNIINVLGQAVRLLSYINVTPFFIHHPVYKNHLEFCSWKQSTNSKVSCSRL